MWSTIRRLVSKTGSGRALWAPTACHFGLFGPVRTARALGLWTQQEGEIGEHLGDRVVRGYR